MIQRLKTTLIAMFMLATPFAVPVMVSAAPAAGDVDPKLAACAGANLDATQLQGGSDAVCTASTADATINDLVRTVINIFTWVVGVVSVIMIIIAGFKYVVSSGDSGGVSSAKNTIIYAIVGLVVVIFAQVIVRFVLTNLNA